MMLCTHWLYFSDFPGPPDRHCLFTSTTPTRPQTISYRITQLVHFSGGDLPRLLLSARSYRLRPSLTGSPCWCISWDAPLPCLCISVATMLPQDVSNRLTLLSLFSREALPRLITTACLRCFRLSPISTPMLCIFRVIICQVCRVIMHSRGRRQRWSRGTGGYRWL